MENNLFYAIAQRTQDGRHINMWLNGSPHRELIAPERLYTLLYERGQQAMIPEIKETIITTYSMYLVDFVNAKIGRLSSIKTKEGLSVMEVLSQAPGIVDAEARQKSINHMLDLDLQPKEENKKNEGELHFWNRKRKNTQADTQFQQFLNNLQNFTK